MANSLEFSTEDFFIRLLKLDSRLSGKPILHNDEEEKAPTKAVVIKATQGESNLAAFGGFNIEVMLELRSPGKTSRVENDRMAAAITEVVYDRNIVSQSTLQQIRADAGLANILIRDESSGGRQNTKDLRKRTITFPCQARLA